MNTLCLENYGVSQMETREMKAVDGGAPWWRVLKAVVVAYTAKNESCGNCLNDAITESIGEVSPYMYN